MEPSNPEECITGSVDWDGLAFREAAVPHNVSGETPSPVFGHNLAASPVYVRDGEVRTDFSGQVILASQRVVAMLAQHPILSIADGRLIPYGPQNRTKWLALLGDARDGMDQAQIMLTREGFAPLFVSAKKHVGSLVLAVRDISRDISEIPNLKRLFGLTPSEHQVIALLLNGKSITEIAEKQGISVLTARTHLKRSYSKIGICTKEQLFALMMRLMVN